MLAVNSWLATEKESADFIRAFTVNKRIGLLHRMGIGNYEGKNFKEWNQMVNTYFMYTLDISNITLCNSKHENKQPCWLP